MLDGWLLHWPEGVRSNLLCTDHGRPVNVSRVEAVVRKAAEQAGLGRVTPAGCAAPAPVTTAGTTPPVRAAGDDGPHRRDRRRDAFSTVCSCRSGTVTGGAVTTRGAGRRIL